MFIKVQVAGIWL